MAAASDRSLAATLVCRLRVCTADELPRVEPIVGRGVVNQVFAVAAGGKEFIVRLNDPGEEGRFRKEAWCAQAAAAVGVPTATALACGVEDGRAYMLLPLLQGVPGDTVPPGAQAAVWRMIGAHLRRLHDELPLSGFGEELTEMHSGRGRFDRYLAENTAALGQDGLPCMLGLLSADEATALTVRFERLARAPLRFALSHGDCSLKNVIVEEDTVSLIDWGCAAAHVVPHSDLGIILADSLDEDSAEFAGLLAGYGLDWDAYQCLWPEMMTVLLVEAVDKLRWAHERCPGRFAAHRERLMFLLALDGACSLSVDAGEAASR